jgi:hypothetical protein
MLDIQGISEPDGAKVAASLRPHLGWTLTLRRTLLALAAVVVAIVLAFGIWRSVQPPPPWEFQGEIYDRGTRMPIAGVEVVVVTGQGEKRTQTDAQGKYELLLPQPQPKSIPILFRKDGYVAEHPIQVRTGQPFNTDMEKLP